MFFLPSLLGKTIAQNLRGVNTAQYFQDYCKIGRVGRHASDANGVVKSCFVFENAPLLNSALPLQISPIRITLYLD